MGAVGLSCSPDGADRNGKSARSVLVLAEGGTPDTKGRRAVDLPCSLNAHTRSIVLLEGRCASKRAVGDQPALAQGESRKIWKKLRCSLGKGRVSARPGWVGEKCSRTCGPIQPAPESAYKQAGRVENTRRRWAGEKRSSRNRTIPCE